MDHVNRHIEGSRTEDPVSSASEPQPPGRLSLFSAVLRAVGHQPRLMASASGLVKHHTSPSTGLAVPPGVPPEEPDAEPEGEAVPAFLDQIQQLSPPKEETIDGTESEGSDEAEEDRTPLVVLDPDHVSTCSQASLAPCTHGELPTPHPSPARPSPSRQFVCTVWAAAL